MSLWEIFDIVTDIVTLPVKIAGAAVECGNDIAEGVSQDIKNTLEGNPEKKARTSYDIREEADKKVEKCNEKYYVCREKLTKQWDIMVQDGKSLAENRANVYALIGKAINSEREIQLPSKCTITYYPPAPVFDSFSFNFGTYLGSAGSKMRMEAAENYLESAKEYESKIDICVSDMNRIKCNVSAVCDAQKEESKMLSVIHASYLACDRSVLTSSREILLEISNLCLGEVNTHTTNQYKKLIQELKALWC